MEIFAVDHNICPQGLCVQALSCLMSGFCGTLAAFTRAQL